MAFTAPLTFVPRNPLIVLPLIRLEWQVVTKAHCTKRALKCNRCDQFPRQGELRLRCTLGASRSARTVVLCKHCGTDNLRTLSDVLSASASDPHASRVAYVTEVERMFFVDRRPKKEPKTT